MGWRATEMIDIYSKCFYRATDPRPRAIKYVVTCTISMGGYDLAMTMLPLHQIFWKKSKCVYFKDLNATIYNSLAQIEDLFKWNIFCIYDFFTRRTVSIL